MKPPLNSPLPKPDRVPPRAGTHRVALVGNPNTGKTTLFNHLTGLNQKVGNYPGVTVERKVGTFQAGPTRIELIDLPGTYSLAARSLDEMIVTDLLLGRREDEAPTEMIVAIVDASNIQRNFYLISQLLELDLPLVIALNMTDIAESRGICIDAAGLTQRLGVPIVPICASRRHGLEELKQTLYQCLEESFPNAQTVSEIPITPSEKPGRHRRRRGWGKRNHIDSDAMPEKRGPHHRHGRKAHARPAFSPAIQEAIAALRDWIQFQNGDSKEPFPDCELLRVLVDVGGCAESRFVRRFGADFYEMLNRTRESLGRGLPLAALETQTRYGWIHEIMDGHIRRPSETPLSLSDRIDRIVMHKAAGFGIFVILMALIFQSIYAWSAPVMNWIDGLFTLLGSWTAAVMPDGTLESLLVDGVIAGAGGVLVFLPQIVVLFLFIALLEDCGYMPRAAFLMDKILARFGLSGKSFIPMLSSFACAVPGIMATRTIEERRDRLATILIAPLMSCSARLPVYILFIAAFIPNRPLIGSWFNLQGVVLFAMYLIGIGVAIPLSWIFNKTMFRGQSSSFIMEMPTYKIPNAKTVVLYVYERAKAFIYRAGTVIVCVAIVVWALAYFPQHPEISRQYESRRQALQAPFLETARPRLEAFDAERYSSTMTDEARWEAIKNDPRLAAENPSPEVRTIAERFQVFQQQRQELVAEEQGEHLRHSLLGWMGQWIEPVVRPLGWDWRIGMATLASFPAREVILATLGTILNTGNEVNEESTSLRTALRAARREDGTPLFTLAVSLSIMVFFALCCQCAATLATIYRETNSWKWPFFTFAYMTSLAYFASLAVYQVMHALGG